MDGVITMANERYNKLKQERRCVRCGGSDVRTKTGHINCEACAKVVAERNKDRYERNKRRGLCTKCGLRIERDSASTVLCKSCNAKQRESEKCENSRRLHRERAKAKYHDRVNRKLCIDCATPLPLEWKRHTCAVCLEIRKRNRIRHDIGKENRNDV